jgi:predicted amidophosphoribosyltransferase
MVCLGCQEISARVLCPSCARTLRPAPPRLLPRGLALHAAFEHGGVAKTLVHHLKYRGVTFYADLVAEVLADRVPSVPLVPVPRALTRRLKYGIDPARAIAIALGSRLHVPVLDVLVAPIHAPRRAGRDHSRRVRIFPTRSPLRSPVVIVDDVVTTGSTVSAATEAIGLELVGAVASANVVANVVRDGSNVRSA